jgi:uncharacterized damage-inducible protein DinB
MATEAEDVLPTVLTGWEDYQISLLRAIGPRTPAELCWRPAPHVRSAGELAAHIIRGRIQWFHYVLREGELAGDADADLTTWMSRQGLEERSAELVSGLEASWRLVMGTLQRSTRANLAQIVPTPPYKGRTYALTRQWIVWHVLAHDLHHGGELALTFGLQGITLPELGGEGGHLAERAPLAEPS